MTQKNGLYEYQHILKPTTRYHILRYISSDRYINRPLAGLIVRLVFNTGITPNQLTWVSFFFGSAGAFSFLGGTHTWFLAGGILSFIGTVLDGADGMLARAKNMRSDYGAHLDLFLDRIVDFFTFNCVIIGLYRTNGRLPWLFAGLLGVALYFLQTSLYYLMNDYRHRQRTGESGEARGLTYFALLVCSLVNRLDIMFWALLIETIPNVLIKFVTMVRWGWEKNHNADKVPPAS